MKNRKKQILDLSNELVQKLGYDSFSYADLSKKLAITKASIHHYFPKKEDLGLELCLHIHQTMKDSLDNVLQLNVCGIEKLISYTKLYAMFADSEDKVCPIASLQA